MSSLKPLIAMQLKDKLDFNYKQSWKKTLFKIVFALIKFILITGIIYLGLSVLSTLRLIDLTGGIPDKFLAVVFTLMFCTFPAGLTLYWVVSNVVTIIQQYFIYKALEKRGLHVKTNK